MPAGQSVDIMEIVLKLPMIQQWEWRALGRSSQSLGQIKLDAFSAPQLKANRHSSADNSYCVARDSTSFPITEL